MNLHKAKGLEAPVVVLARPFAPERWDPDFFVERGADGARGWLRVREGGGRAARVLACPLDWEEKESAERAFEAAEEVRLLYVAATRAQQELVVVQPSKDPSRPPWGPLRFALEQHAMELDLTPSPPPHRERLEVAAEELARRERAAEAGRAQAGVEGYRFMPVTRLAKLPLKQAGPGMPEPNEAIVVGLSALDPSHTGPGGYAWGSAVHAVLEAAARGVNEERLRSLAAMLLAEMDGDEDGRPQGLDALMSTVASVMGADLWVRARRAERQLAEVPFAVAWDRSETSQLDPAGDHRPSSYLEGVIDLAFLEADGWVIVDYKTDRTDRADFETRRASYREQLRLYSQAWERLTRQSVKERILWFVRAGIQETIVPN